MLVNCFDVGKNLFDKKRKNKVCFGFLTPRLLKKYYALEVNKCCEVYQKEYLTHRFLGGNVCSVQYVVNGKNPDLDFFRYEWPSWYIYPSISSKYLRGVRRKIMGLLGKNYNKKEVLCTQK